MKTAFFIRHAKSSWADMDLSDIDRPLNKRGMRDAPFMAKLLKGKGANPDRLISSPAKRAFTTASFFAEAFDIPASGIEVRNTIYETYVEDVLAMVRKLPEELDQVLIFGHNPTFTSLASMFSSTYIPNIPTCGIFQLEAKIEKWSKFDTDIVSLVALYYPKQYFS